MISSLLPGFKTFRALHHDYSHNHPRVHEEHPAGGTETRKNGIREIKVVRRVLDANDIMARQNRKLSDTIADSLPTFKLTLSTRAGAIFFGIDAVAISIICIATPISCIDWYLRIGFKYLG